MMTGTIRIFPVWLFSLQSLLQWFMARAATQIKSLNKSGLLVTFCAKFIQSILSFCICSSLFLLLLSVRPDSAITLWIISFVLQTLSSFQYDQNRGTFYWLPPISMPVCSLRSATCFIWVEIAPIVFDASFSKFKAGSRFECLAWCNHECSEE